MFILEFPQNLFGYLSFLICTKIRKFPYKFYQDAYIVHVSGTWGAISMSKYIFIDDNHESLFDIKHEYGHRIHSRLLLFLYLLVIGIPSLIWAGLFKKYRIKYKKSYYWFYTEAWANKLVKLDLK